MSELAAKHQRQRDYASRYLSEFEPHYMLWSPIVRSGLIARLQGLPDMELFVNHRYSQAIGELSEQARHSTADINNPAFRVLQILGHMRSPSRP